ncbi:translocation protein Sec62-domain-containing protein [Pelagophyceae sp. CCMP2097]|nr:translocation protein Sec62-domain-containing protein [Pelagophyceae sp. CCMP2097]|mmetsp:Transcript_6581/g.21247  ORF Transcript_6581/g.21247 Transcript_6581/m.21247 type:complete len:352 (+) Transcript_6581:69-1124(+)
MAAQMYETESGLKTIAEFCRGSTGVQVKAAVERLKNHADTDRRVEYFRGEKLVMALLGECAASKDGKKPKKKKQPFTAKDVDDATAACQALLRENYVHRATRTGKGRLEFVPQLGQKWDPTGFYVWDFEGSKRLTNFMSGLLIFSMIACTCFPIWPVIVKVYVWYCAVTFLIVMTVFVIVRFIVFISFWLVGYDFWLIPNFFDESLTVIDSFKPLYSFAGSPRGQRYYRAALCMGSWAFFVWCYNQPTDFDVFLTVQKEFVADLYEGKLLTDFSQQGKDDIDKIKRPSFETLAMEEEEEKKERLAREEVDRLHKLSQDTPIGDLEDEESDEAAAEMMERMLAGEDDEEPED